MRSTPGTELDFAEVRAYLDKVLSSSSFAGGLRVQQFLRFVVEETLEGRAGEIKESIVAVKVFGRRSDFDSRSDSVVRVQATHLRKRLREYYRTEGLRDGVIIELPPGAYVPDFRSAALSDVPDTGGKKRSWRLPALGLSALAVAAVALWILGRLAPDSPTSIAVLPFATLDAAPEGDYLAEGIAEDLMTSLARSPSLRVVARSSAFQFRDRNINARSIGRDLGVSVLLEGSIRGEPDHLRVTAHLVNADSGFDIWSESWEGTAADAPLFEEQIVRSVRRVLGKAASKREPAEAAAAIRPPSPGAQEPYWRGRILLSKAPDIQRGSIPFLEQAVRADPQYAPAHAALTTAYVMGLYHGYLYPRDEPLKKARIEGARALDLDPSSAEAYASLAMLSFVFDHDWTAAQRGFEKALELNPSDARAHLQYAMGLVTRGRFSEAIAHANQARVLDPLSFSATNDRAIALYCAGRYDESIAAARHALAADPGFTPARVAIGRGLAGVYCEASLIVSRFRAIP